MLNSSKDYLIFFNDLFSCKSIDEIQNFFISYLDKNFNLDKIALIKLSKNGHKFFVAQHKDFNNEAIDIINNLNTLEPSLFSQVFAKKEIVNSLSQRPLPAPNQAIAQIHQTDFQFAIPLTTTNNEFLGIITIDTSNERTINDIDQINDLCQLFANSSYNLANSIKLSLDLNAHEKINSLRELADKQNPSLDDYLDNVLETFCSITQTNQGFVLIEENSQLHLANYRGFSPVKDNIFNSIVTSVNATNSLESLKPKINEFKSNRYHDFNALIQSQSFNSVITIPIFFDRVKLGVIELFSDKSPENLSISDTTLLKLSSSVAATLRYKFLTDNQSLASLLCTKTGLLNQVHLLELFAKELKRTKRKSRPLGVLCLNIDHLGLINAHLGKQLADRAIDYVAQKIKIALRENDLLFYTDNGEFIIILPETTQSHSLLVSERIKNMVREEACPSVGKVTVSVGVATYPESADSPKELINQSNQAMRMAKLEGRDRVKLLSKPLNLESSSWKTIANDAKLINVESIQSKTLKSDQILSNSDKTNKVKNFFNKKKNLESPN